MIDENSPNAAVILEAGKQIADLAGATKMTNGMPVVMIPSGFEFRELPHLLKAPLRKKGVVMFQDLASFARFFTEHKTAESIITADVDPTGARGAMFTGILNYHGTTEEAAAFGDFRGVYTAQLSVEWKRWMEKNKVAMNHGDFCEHLEANSDLILEPAGAALLELISALEGTVDVKFANALNLHNGKVKLNYEEDVSLRSSGTSATRPGALEVPNELVTGIAPFQFGDVYKMRNRLRYRVQNRTLVFAYEAIDSHKIIQDAVSGQCAKVKELTGVEPFYAVAPAACA